jgi:uncharacterized protein
MPGRYAVCRLPRGSGIPDWADGAGFASITRTADELSIVCEEERVPPETQSDRGWCCMQVRGPFAFQETGIAAAVATPLAHAAICVLLIATFDTDYLLVKADDFQRAREALVGAGHSVEG